MEIPAGTEIEFLSFPRQSVPCATTMQLVLSPSFPMRVTGLAVNRECAQAFLIREMRTGMTPVIQGAVDACAFDAPGKALPDTGITVFPGQTISILVENISSSLMVFSAWIAFWRVPARELERLLSTGLPALAGPRVQESPPALGRELPSRKFSFDEE